MSMRVGDVVKAPGAQLWQEPLGPGVDIDDEVADVTVVDLAPPPGGLTLDTQGVNATAVTAPMPSRSGQGVRMGAC